MLVSMFLYPFQYTPEVQLRSAPFEDGLRYKPERINQRRVNCSLSGPGESTSAKWKPIHNLIIHHRLRWVTALSRGVSRRQKAFRSDVRSHDLKPLVVGVCVCLPVKKKHTRYLHLPASVAVNAIGSARTEASHGTSKRPATASAGIYTFASVIGFARFNYSSISEWWRRGGAFGKWEHFHHDCACAGKCQLGKRASLAGRSVPLSVI